MRKSMSQEELNAVEAKKETEEVALLQDFYSGKGIAGTEGLKWFLNDMNAEKISSEPVESRENQAFHEYLHNVKKIDFGNTISERELEALNKILTNKND